ncbi:N-acetylmuramoyl-L-alanine amidase [Streptomyces sp. CBMA29]|uniref:N-acetylmuramoyl-L-alanine amidase n=1 Tax=Streptomyces sp. CBMA29 TaxID=1896314 RepID=UPI002948C47D|nr:N-acetylmuramoyl-L-alanine amidase [Streptomyces sp. CBMA29]
MLASVATYGTIAIATPSPGGGTDAKAGGSATSLQDAFASAAKEFKVPQSVLMAVSYQQTLWEAHNGQPSTTGNYNVMGLTQVNSSDLEQPTAAEVTNEVNQSGDPSRTKDFDAAAARSAPIGKVDTADPRLHTLDAAAKLIGTPAADLRGDRAESVRGGAALLAQYEKDAYGSLPADAGRWYAAVARYSQSPDAAGAKLFADRVFGTLRDGASTVTADGQQVSLAPAPSVKAVPLAKTPLAAQADATANPTPECPASLACDYVPAAYKQNGTGDPSKYGNYDIANRQPDASPGNGSPDIRYIVIHDTEAAYASVLNTFQNPATLAGANYVIRASDGKVTQMVENKNIVWHAGNMGVNQHSIGIEHEGYAIKKGSWYSEPEYNSSATLVKFLAAKYHIPLDREHIFGHDEVPGPLDSYVAGMHWDPGPYWDWNHYMALIGAPTGVGSAGGPLKVGQIVTIVPPFTTANQPTVTYQPPTGSLETYTQPADFVWLRTSASSTAPLLSDPYLRSSGAGTSRGPDWGDKAVAGTRYVVAGTSGDWTAIWYGGQKAWFNNPGNQWTAPVNGGTQTFLTPKGSAAVPVYGRTYPDTAAFSGTPVEIPQDTDKSLSKYSIPAGQSYAQAGPAVAGDFYYAKNINGDAPGDRTLITSKTKSFYPIRFNHRIGYVLVSDVQQQTSAAPDPGTTRYNLLARDASGGLYQYQGTGNATGPFYTKFKVGPGWQIFNAITAMTALRADGTGDLVARDASGVLWYYQGSGKPSAPFKARLKTGPGWNVYNMIIGARDLNGDGKADLIGRDASGNLWYYQGSGNPAAPFATKVKIGPGWNAYNLLVSTGDITGDGKADLIARDASGVLWLYKGTGIATGPYAPKVQIGPGWNAYNTLVGASDLNGDGKGDLVARDSAGNLWYYQGRGTATGGPFATKVKIGPGWNAYNLLF